MGRGDTGHAHRGEEARVNHLVLVEKVKPGAFMSL